MSMPIARPAAPRTSAPALVPPTRDALAADCIRGILHGQPLPEHAQRARPRVVPPATVAEGIARILAGKAPCAES